MITDLQSKSSLAGITNVSDTSVTYNLLEMFATEVYLLEKLCEQAFVDIEDRGSDMPAGTLKWYAYQTKLYQHGDTLTVVDGVAAYAVVDDTKWVVDLSSATEQDGAVLIKAAKLNMSGQAEPLSVAEKAGLEGYWIEKRFAGTSIFVISQEGDELTVTARIEVDGTKIASDGESIASPGTYPVEEAITAYLQQLDFEGRMLVMDLSNAMEAVDGVKNVVITDCKAKEYGVVDYTNILAQESRSYRAVAGYMIEDTTTPFNTTLTYVVA